MIDYCWAKWNIELEMNNTNDGTWIGHANGNSLRVFASIEFARVPPQSDFAVRVFVNLPNANKDTRTEDPHFAGSFASSALIPRVLRRQVVININRSSSLT
jgi:hypothetical protein